MFILKKEQKSIKITASLFCILFISNHNVMKAKCFISSISPESDNSQIQVIRLDAFYLFNGQSVAKDLRLLDKCAMT